MKREFLEGLKLEADVIDKIMAENGKDVNREKAKFADYDELKAQLEAANKTLDGFKDYEAVKADVEKYKAESERIKKEADGKIAALERSSKVKDFLSGKKFVNDLTREALASELSKQLESDAAKGKSLDELFDALTKDKENIFADDKKPTPPVVGSMTGTGAKETGVVAAFKNLNPNLKID
jgi:phage minor structural protein GP20